ncbi:exopolysaccharide biosynthesis protein [Stutzerimonas nosocomialis]|uniref:exopolysaccharide biosynthesis protein n=1 Tax=Stutzerimonas nosocomialis TaxID=1056496 RepID=UPI00110828DC|nr:exopolysaccharide biosynthesis protein [Stutzerimonas nosocomialis]TLX55765.1 exopolysaccharide biosynthesis protein [Stutzerimonas nosocomialis]TLX58532.1 exopolysaccharide biosynthesis protein [Stutzerimonas nosocomialis]
MADTHAHEFDCLEKVIDEVIGLGEGGSEVSVGDIQQTIGERSFGPFLFVPAIIEVSPIGGIPGLPTLLAAIIALFALQLLFGRRHLWMPGFLARRSVKGQKLEKGLNKVRPLVRWLDKVSRHRLPWATRGVFLRVIAVLCVLLTLSVPPLELVPFASTAPFSAICLFGLGLTTRDGAAIVLGMVVTVGAFVLLGMGLTG